MQNFSPEGSLGGCLASRSRTSAAPSAAHAETAWVAGGFRRLGAIRERGRRGRARRATWQSGCHVARSGRLRAAFAEDGVERGVDGDVGEGRGWSAARRIRRPGRALVEGLGEEGGEIGGVLGRARDGDRGGEDDGFPLGPSLGGPSLGAGGGEDRGAAEVAGDGVGVAELVGRERHLASGVALGGLGHGRELGVDAAKGGGDETLQRAGITAAARQLQGRHRRREDGGRRRRGAGALGGGGGRKGGEGGGASEGATRTTGRGSAGREGAGGRLSG